MVDISNLYKWHFEITEKASNYLLGLVLEGKKRATASSLWAYELDDPITHMGEQSVITYWDGTPACVVRTTNVRILPFCDITFDIAKLEGEDENLESWRRKHKRFFEEEGKQVGYEFTEDMLVVFEEFEVVEVL